MSDGRNRHSRDHQSGQPRHHQHSRDHQSGQPRRHQQGRPRTHNQLPLQYPEELVDSPPRTEQYSSQHGYQDEYDDSYNQEEYTYPDREYSQDEYDVEPGNSIIEDESQDYEVTVPDHPAWRQSPRFPNIGRVEDDQGPVRASRGPQTLADPPLHEPTYETRPNIGHHYLSSGHEQGSLNPEHYGAQAQPYIGGPHMRGHPQGYYNPTGNQTVFIQDSSERPAWEWSAQHPPNISYAPPTMPHDPRIPHDPQNSYFTGIPDNWRIVYEQRMPYTQGFPGVAPADRPRPHPYRVVEVRQRRQNDPQPNVQYGQERTGPQVRVPMENPQRHVIPSLRDPGVQHERRKAVPRPRAPPDTPRHGTHAQPTSLLDSSVPQERERTVLHAQVPREISPDSAHAQSTSSLPSDVQHGRKGTVPQTQVPPNNPWKGERARSTIPPANVQHERRTAIDTAQPPLNNPHHSGSSGRQPMSQMRSKGLASVDPKGDDSAKSAPTLDDMPPMRRGDSSAINEQLKAKRPEVKVPYKPPPKPKSAAKPKSTPQEPKADEGTSFKEVRRSNVTLPKATLPASTPVPNPVCSNFGCDADDHRWKDCNIPWYCARCGGVEHCMPNCPWKSRTCPNCRRTGHSRDACMWWKEGHWSQRFRDAQRATRHEYHEQLRSEGGIHKDILSGIDSKSPEWKTLPWVRHQQRKGAPSGTSASKGQPGNRYDILTHSGVHHMDEDDAQEIVRDKQAKSSEKDKRHDQSLAAYMPPGAEEDSQDAESSTETESATTMDQIQVDAGAKGAGVTEKTPEGQANMARPTGKSSSKAKQATSETADRQHMDSSGHDKAASSPSEDAPHDDNPDQSTEPSTEPSTGPSTEPPPQPPPDVSAEPGPVKGKGRKSKQNGVKK